MCFDAGDRDAIKGRLSCVSAGSSNSNIGQYREKYVFASQLFTFLLAVSPASVWCAINLCQKILTTLLTRIFGSFFVIQMPLA